MSEYSAPPAPIPSVIDLSILNQTFDILKRRLRPLATVGAIYMMVTLFSVGGLAALWITSFMAIAQGAGPDNIIAIMMGLYLNPFFLAIIVLSYVLPILAQGAFSAMTFQELRGEEPTYTEGIRALKENFGSLLILALVMSVAYVLLSFACSLLPIFAQAAFFLAVPAIIDQKMKPMDALKYSYEKVKDSFWNVLALSFLSGAISGLGVIICCIGLAFTAPVAGIAPTLAYWRLTRGGGVQGDSPYPRSDYYVAPQETAARASETPRPETLFPPTQELPETSTFEEKRPPSENEG